LFMREPPLTDYRRRFWPSWQFEEALVRNAERARTPSLRLPLYFRG
jgi:hypothetical protein